MEEQYKKFLADCEAYITFGINQQVGVATILSNLSHDISGVLRWGINSGIFMPRVTGYAEWMEKEGQRAAGTEK
jgi:hypothetical protein